jgi:hypothetical protein
MAVPTDRFSFRLEKLDLIIALLVAGLGFDIANPHYIPADDPFGRALSAGLLVGSTLLAIVLTVAWKARARGK